MPIPDYQSLMRPLLAFGQDGKEKNIGEAISSIAKEINLSQAEREELLPSGQTIFYNRVHWARTYLDKSGAIKKTRRSHFMITERGTKLLAENPIKINISVLRQFPEFVAFQTPKVSDQEDAATDVHDVELPQTTPRPRKPFSKPKPRYPTV